MRLGIKKYILNKCVFSSPLDRDAMDFDEEPILEAQCSNKKVQSPQRDLGTSNQSLREELRLLFRLWIDKKLREVKWV